MIRIRVTVKDIKKRLTPERWNKFVEDMSADLVAQVRRNIIVEGGPGGGWPKLSGFGEGVGGKQHTAAKASIKEQRKLFRKEGVGSKDVIDDAAKRLRQVTAHSGYARRKADGKTPGHGKHGADERLRDTDGLFNALTAETTISHNKTRIWLTAEGKNAKGTEFKTILVALALGTVHIPARNPTEHMEQFEARFERLLVRLFEGEVGA